jgi:hypothetical protein
MAKKRTARVVAGHICLANGSISLVRARRIPLVSALAAAISDIGLDHGSHRLDGEHYPGICPVALARTWTSVGAASCLGNAAGIRLRRNRSRNYRFAPDQPIGRSTMLQRTARVKRAAFTCDFFAPKEIWSSSELSMKTDFQAVF